MKRVTLPRAVVRAPAILIFLTVVAALYFGREVFVPLALAFMVTFLLAPAVRRLERWKFPRSVAVIVTVSLATLFVGGVGWVVEVQVVELARKLPEYRANILSKIQTLRPSGSGVLGRTGNLFSELGQELSKPTPASSGNTAAPTEIPVAPTAVRLVDQPTPPLTYLRDLLGPVLTRLAMAGIVIVFATFMLIYREDLRSRLIMLIGERQIYVTTPALDEAGQRVTRYLVMQTISNATAGVTIGLGMFLLGIPNAPLWGLVIALLRYIPYVGVWIGAALPLTLSLALSPGWTQPLMTFSVILVVEILLGNFIEPLLFSSGTGLSPIAVLGSAVFWAWLWGPAGLLLSTPLTVCLAVLGRHVPRLKYLEILMGDAPVLRPEAQFYQRILAGDQDESMKLLKAEMKDNPGEVFDTLLLPALRLCEEQRDDGNLDDARETEVMDMFSSFVDDVALQLTAGIASPTMPIPAQAVLCIPASDRADELAARMLEGALAKNGMLAQTLSSDSMMGEILEQVSTFAPLVVCISALPPGSTLHARVLAKRLRARFPTLPIVVGIWDGATDAQNMRLTFGTGITDHVVTTVAQAAAKIQSLTAAPMAAVAIPTVSIRATFPETV